MSPETVCPVSAMARILGARWTMQIIHNLRQRRRFCELQELVGGVNPTTLSQRLKFLEEQGLIHRLPISDVPPHVEYELTGMGRDLLPILDALARWADKWLPLHAPEEDTMRRQSMTPRQARDGACRGVQDTAEGASGC